MGSISFCKYLGCWQQILGGMTPIHPTLFQGSSVDGWIRKVLLMYSFAWSRCLVLVTQPLPFSSFPWARCHFDLIYTWQLRISFYSAPNRHLRIPG